MFYLNRARRGHCHFLLHGRYNNLPWKYGMETMQILLLHKMHYITVQNATMLPGSENIKLRWNFTQNHLQLNCVKIYLQLKVSLKFVISDNRIHQNKNVKLSAAT